MQSQSFDEAVKALQDFRKTFPESGRKRDAELLNGTALLAGGQRAEALKYFTDIRKAKGHPHAGRATVLELHCLIEEGKDEEALDLLAEIGPEMGSKINQLATFQTLALSLGGKFLDEERPRDAIRALQNIWPRERLVDHQKRKLEEIKQALAKIESAQEPDIFARAHHKQMLREVEKELTNLEKIPSFDASVRFRLATAFHNQDRYRECAMLLDDMLRQMAPDDVVEKASMSALQSWMAIERYERAVSSSLVFEEQFPSSKSLPLVLYLRGTAQQKLDEHSDAITTFVALREKFADSEQAPRALFMMGFTQLLAERNEEAAESFRQFHEQYPKHELAEAANYWRGSALTFAKKFPEAREVLAAHAGKFPQGGMQSAASFRLAYCAQSMKDYALAETELKDYLKRFPDGEESAEARLLLGDALLAQAKSDEGKEIYSSIKPESGRFQEDAQFKLAKVLKLEEKYDELRALMQTYIDAKPRSPRVAEAMLQIGQAHRKEDNPGKAVEAYWKAIGEWGDDPQAAAVEEMLLALDRHYKGESEKRDFHARLRASREEAEGEGKNVLAVRCVWALARGVKKSDPALSGALLREAGAIAKPEQTSPLILADCAEALLAASAENPGLPESTERRARGAQLYRDLLKWYPRAAQKDKALAALAKVALDAGDTETAMAYYDRLERDTPWSSLMGEVLTKRAGIELEAGNQDKAVEAYTRLLAAENVPSKLKAQALLSLGEIEMSRQRPQTAIPYYQRIYVLYGKWRDTVAQAYLRSGEAFEQINDTEAARKTYEELANNEDLGSLPQAQTAREKLKKFAPKDQSKS
jgi:TolA-binding protein